MIIRANSLTYLPAMPTSSVDAIITNPYMILDDPLDPLPLVEECLRISKGPVVMILCKPWEKLYPPSLTWYFYLNELKRPVRVYNSSLTLPEKEYFTDFSLHEYEKPVELLESLVTTYTKPGDLVLDPFAGSGSTLLACSRLNRRCLGIELDEAHTKTTKRRLP